MKKIIFLLLFSSSLLYCFAEEGLQIRENNEPLLFYPGLSLPLFGSDSSFNQTYIFDSSTNSLGWERTGFKLTPYAEYEPRSFFSIAKPWIFGIGGMIAFFAGCGLVASWAGGGPDYQVFLGTALMMGGAGLYVMVFL